MRHILPQGILEAHIYQGRRETGLDQGVGVLFHGILQHPGFEIGRRKQWAGLRHPVGGKDLNAQFHGLLGQSLGEAGAADDNLPEGKVVLLRRRAGYQHLNDCRDAVREGDPLRKDEFQEHSRFVTSRIDLLYPQHGGRPGKAPGMDVEHRGDGHIDVIGLAAANGGIRTGGQEKCLGVEDQLAVGEINPFGQAGGAGGVEDRSLGVLVQVGEIIRRRRRRQHFLVLHIERHFRCRFVPVVGNQDDLFDRRKLVPDRIEEGHKILMDQDDLVFRMIHRIEDLLGRKPPVLGMHDGAHHGYGKETLQIAVAVVIEDAYPVSGPNADLFQAVGQAMNPFVEGPVGKTHLVPVNDFLVRGKRQWHFEDVLDQQLILVRFSGCINFFCHKIPSSFF